MIVLDSSFFIAYKNARDVNHDRAVRTWPSVLDRASVLVHEYAFVEIVTVLGARLGLATAVEAGRELLSARDAEVVPATPRFDASWQAFSGQERFALSLADAAMLHLAEEAGASHVATFDAALAEAARGRGWVVVA